MFEHTPTNNDPKDYCKYCAYESTRVTGIIDILIERRLDGIWNEIWALYKLKLLMLVGTDKMRGWEDIHREQNVNNKKRIDISSDHLSSETFVNKSCAWNSHQFT